MSAHLKLLAAAFFAAGVLGGFLVPGDSMTDQLVMIAPRASTPGGDAGQAIFPNNIYTGTNRQTKYVGTSVTQYTFSGLSPGYQHFTVATINAVGHVHGWPDSAGFYLNC